MTLDEKNPLYAAAVLKLTFLLKGTIDDPGFRFVYFGTLKKMGLTNHEVDVYIDANRADLERKIRAHGGPGGE